MISMTEAAIRNRVRNELTRALSATSTLASLRECLVHLVCDLDPSEPGAPPTVDQAAPTERSVAPDAEDSAPSVPADADEIRAWDSEQAKRVTVALANSRARRSA